MHEKVAALIPAAGYSHRMGAFKPLLELGGKTIIERAVASFAAAGVDDIRVVAGHDRGSLIPVLERLGTRIIVNDHYHEGMFSSVLAALETMAPDIDAFFLLPADIPLVRPWTIKYLVENASLHENKILIPTFMGRRGHPPLIPSLFIDRIKNWKGDRGLKGALSQFADETVPIKTGDENVLFDVDEPADYDLLKEKWARYHVPSRNECEALLRDVFQVEDRICRHCRAVAALAEGLARDLNRAGYNLDIDAVVAAGLLHDMVRGRKRHDREAARLLADMGYPGVAEMIGSHMNIAFSPEDVVGGAEVLYLADKCVKEEEPLSLAQRLQDEIKKRGHDPAVREAIETRLHRAMIIRDRIESITGRKIPGGILHSHLTQVHGLKNNNS